MDQPAETRRGKSIDAVVRAAAAAVPEEEQLRHNISPRKTEKQLLHQQPLSNNKHSPHSHHHHQHHHRHHDVDVDDQTNGNIPTSRHPHHPNHEPVSGAGYESVFTNGNNNDKNILMSSSSPITMDSALSRMREDDQENHNLVISDHVHDQVIVKFSQNTVTLKTEYKDDHVSHPHLGDDDDEDDEEGKENDCGILSFRPSWMQHLANKNTFLIVFSLTSILQGMYFTYFVSVLTTIEKLFQFQSKTTGVIMSATEVGQIGGALLLTYYGGQGHRPKWIAAGMIIFATACLLCATPHFLFGGQSLLQADPLSSSSSSSSSSSQIRADFSQSLCQRTNSSSFPSSGRLVNHKCDNEELKTAQSLVTTWVLIIFFISLFLIGIGVTAVNTLAIPYIDDNVAPRDSPLYFGITIGVKIFGPVFGFLLGSVCTSIYVDFPFETGSGLAPSDPQWISAWWMGVMIIGISLLFASIPMMAFPKKLPSPDPSSYCHRQQEEMLKQKMLMAKKQQQQEAEKFVTDKDFRITNGSCDKTQSDDSMTDTAGKKPSLRDFPAAVGRLVSNKLLLLRTASSVLHILPIAGLYTFLPKYLESQFQLTASNANAISGVAGILVMGFGIFASGIFMRICKPSARFVAAWIAGTALMYGIGMMILMFLGCDQKTTSFAGLGRQGDSFPIHATCGSQCSCPSGEFSPICTSEGITYLSPCIAGCSTATTVNLTYQFTDCSCLKPDVSAVHGNCVIECSNLIWYIITFSFFVLVHSTSEVGSMLLTLRCVQPQDKAMALGLVSFSIGLFGNVPCPIVYGVVIDSACLFWEKTCGEAGACRLYDTDRFRFVFHGITAFIMFAAFAVDLVVCFMASSVTFDDEPADSPLENDNKIIVQSNELTDEKKA